MPSKYRHTNPSRQGIIDYIEIAFLRLGLGYPPEWENIKESLAEFEEAIRRDERVAREEEINAQ